MKIAYKASVESDLRRLDKKSALRLLGQLEKKLATGSHSHVALRGEFAGLYRLRLGEYRVIYAPTGDGFLILRIGHRKDIYRKGPPAR